MKTSHLLPRDLYGIIFRGFLRLCWSARPAAFARIREQLELTQNDLATTLEATRITISGWENGRFLPNETNVERYHNALLDKAKLDGKSESWLIDTIFAEIPELYDAVPKMHDARRYQIARARMGSVWSENVGANEELDRAIDIEMQNEQSKRQALTEFNSGFEDKMFNGIDNAIASLEASIEQAANLGDQDETDIARSYSRGVL